jgi:hypothetical protein
MSLVIIEGQKKILPVGQKRDTRIRRAKETLDQWGHQKRIIYSRLATWTCILLKGADSATLACEACLGY